MTRVLALSLPLIAAICLACTDATGPATGRPTVDPASLEPTSFSLRPVTPPVQAHITGLSLYDCHGVFLGNWGRTSATGVAYPNPFRDTTWFVYTLANFSVVEMFVERAVAPGERSEPTLRNSNGAVIQGDHREIVWSEEAPLEAGVHNKAWYGQTNDGGKVEPGYYRIHVSIPSRGLAGWFDVLYAADESDVHPGVPLFTDCSTPDPRPGDD